MKMKNNFKWLLFASVAIVACSDEIEEKVIDQPLTAGSADFSRYIALGNSLTAGFSDGALFIAGQNNAYPNIMSIEFEKFGGGSFKTPFMSDNLGGFQTGGVQFPEAPTRLFFNSERLNNCGNVDPGPSNAEGLSTTVLGQSIASSGPYQNLGIPGAKVGHLLFSGYALANPYFGRIASSPTATVIGDAISQNHTFFSLWIGNNDVLGFATSGGDGSNPITNTSDFTNAYNSLINSLTQNGQKGVVANIPSVTSIPYFTTVPHNPITAQTLGRGLLPCGSTNEQQITAGTAAINQLNSQLLGPLSQILTALGQPDRIQLLNPNGNNPLLIVDEGLSNLGAQITQIAANSGNPQLVALSDFLGSVYGQARHAKPSDLICLPTSNVIGTPAGSPVPTLNAFGISYPLQDQHVLVPVEQDMIQVATTDFNNAIKAAVDSKGLAFVDAFEIMNKIASTGYQQGGFNFTSAYIFGNTFSLDGVHLSPRANALVANKMMEAINATYGSNLRPVRLSAYPILYGKDLP